MTEIERLFAESEGRPLSLVFTGKHGREMFVCTDAGEAYGFCLSVLWQRYHSGYYFEEEAEPSLPPLTKEQIDRMPDGETKQGAINEWVIYENGIRAAEWRLGFCYPLRPTQRRIRGFEILPAERTVILPGGDLLQEKPETTYYL